MAGDKIRDEWNKTPHAKPGEIAIAAGVSPSAVSKWFHRGDNLEWLTRRRVKHDERIEAATDKAAVSEIEVASKLRMGALARTAKAISADDGLTGEYSPGAVKGLDYSFRIGDREHERAAESGASEARYGWTVPVPARKPIPGQPGAAIECEPYITDARPYVPPDWRGLFNVGFTPHAYQADFAQKWLDYYEGKGPKHLVLKAGRRSGKTEVVLAIADAACQDKAHWSDKGPFRVVIMLPTLKQAEAIYWAGDNGSLVAKRFSGRAKFNKSKLRVTFDNGAMIQFASAEVAFSSEGGGVDLVILDEFGICEQEYDMKRVMGESLESMLADRDGRWVIIGTPKGGAGLYEVYWNKADGSDPLWGRATWSMVHNPYIPLHRVNEIIAEMDEQTAAQEIWGLFILRAGACYHFDPARNSTEYEFDSAHDMHLSFDFNVDWYSIGVAQVRTIKGRRALYFVDEFRPKGRVGTADAMEQFMAYKGGLYSPAKFKGRVVLHGDASGSADRTAGRAGYSDWVIIKQRLAYGVEVNGLRYNYAEVAYDVPNANPLKSDRVNTMNSRLKPINGQPRLFIHPRCELIRRDLLQQAWDEKLREPDKKQEKNGIGHMADMVGYAVFAVDPLKAGEMVTAN